MPWTPSHFDPKAKWHGYEFCIISFPAGDISDGPEVDLIFRQGSDAWASIGASDGNVYMETAWVPEKWPAANIEINKRLSDICTKLGIPPLVMPTLPASGTFAELEDALFKMTWGEQIAATDARWGPRWFHLGDAIEAGEDKATGALAIRVNQSAGWTRVL